PIRLDSARACKSAAGAADEVLLVEQVLLEGAGEGPVEPRVGLVEPAQCREALAPRPAKCDCQQRYVLPRSCLGGVEGGESLGWVRCHLRMRVMDDGLEQDDRVPRRRSLGENLVQGRNRLAFPAARQRDAGALDLREERIRYEAGRTQGPPRL